ncbi:MULTISPECIES: isochorismatase family protein [Thioalkalivibrio]|uniref:isochorismatase family protein n=1 Tax=Thioalkalivibrio TaxID=106633 RepID=UPI0003686460|nr:MULTISPECIES: isochorismatase family protein [Thioalkalivibrio]OOC49770.1 nicotinamidase [Thioalkalivibrio versutus]
MTDDPRNHLQAGDALLVIHVQNDFCPGGALAIEHGDTVIPVLNRWLEAAAALDIPVYASRDWHPAGHASFVEQGGPWPPHCLQDSPGARFHADLALPAGTVKVTTGVRFDQDQYSAFDQTGLAGELRNRGVKRIWMGGLALDVCVAATALGAREEGFDVHLIPYASLPISPQGGTEARAKMRAAGVEIAEHG